MVAEPVEARLVSLSNHARNILRRTSCTAIIAPYFALFKERFALDYHLFIYIVTLLMLVVHSFPCETLDV